jgi:hypothetical protein
MTCEPERQRRIARADSVDVPHCSSGRPVLLGLRIARRKAAHVAVSRFRYMP